MSSNSTELEARVSALVDDFWASHVVALAERLRARGVTPLGPKTPASTWQASPDVALALSASESLRAQLTGLWNGEPELLARVDAIVELAESLAALEPAEEAEVSSQMYVMF